MINVLDFFLWFLFIYLWFAFLLFLIFFFSCYADETEPRDLIDNYLLEMKKGREGFTKDELVITIFDLFAAGSETTSTTLRFIQRFWKCLIEFLVRWAIMFLLLNPEVQRKCHKELDEISDSIPSLSDMDKLHYCQATILGNI